MEHLFAFEMFVSKDEFQRESEDRDTFVWVRCTFLKLTITSSAPARSR